MIISERIFELLREKGISQKEFSEKTGIAQSTISDWKRKRTNPAADKLMVICDVLQISLYELLVGTENSGRYQVDYITVDKGSEDYCLLEQYRALPQEDRERIFGYLQSLQDKGRHDK